MDQADGKPHDRPVEFRNHTPFPALQFEGIDPNKTRFYVVALRQTLTWNEQGALEYCDRQESLCEEDTYFGESFKSSVRQESDLCHFKHKCDVIVNATAYAPSGRPVRHFDVSLSVRGKDSPAPLPEKPNGLNPLTPPSDEEVNEWSRALDKAKRTRIPGKVFIDKHLRVTGERAFVFASPPIHALRRGMSWGSFGVIGFNPWRLTRPRPISHLPLRYEYAWGGECRIDAGDPGAHRVAQKYRLTAQQRNDHPDAGAKPESQAIAHTALNANPIGLGFVQEWYVKAKKIKRVKAPQIEGIHSPINQTIFWNTLRGKVEKAATDALPVGLGIRYKGHPDRLKLGGVIDETFIKSGEPLPKDFDFAVWNAAPPDQQTDYLQGDEIIEVTNLCSPNAKGAWINEAGNTVLRLQLPHHECFLVVRMMNGHVFPYPMNLDTVILEPDSSRLSLVWRAQFVRDEGWPIRVLEAMMRAFGDKPAGDRGETVHG